MDITIHNAIAILEEPAEVRTLDGRNYRTGRDETPYSVREVRVVTEAGEVVRILIFGTVGLAAREVPHERMSSESVVLACEARRGEVMAECEPREVPA